MGLKLRIIPSLLLLNGRLVKGRYGKDYRDAGHPVTTVRSLCAQGADEILLLDIAEDAPHWDVLEAVADECTVPLTFGGGIRTSEDARSAFQAGADKIFINSARHGFIRDLVGKCGRQAVVAGIDVEDHAESIAECGGAGELRALSMLREGSRSGFDLRLIRQSLDTPLILEGGAGKLQHIADAFRAGASAVALGTMLVFGDNNIVKIKRYLAKEGFPVRL